MWIIPMTISMTTILLYIFKKYKKETCIENITSIEDVVFFIQCISHKLTPDELIWKIVQILKQNPQSISHKQIKKISDLFKKYGHQNNSKGYAICVLWSAVVFATHDNLIDFKT